MRTIRLTIAVTLFMFARLLKILTVYFAPDDLKKDFRDNI